MAKKQLLIEVEKEAKEISLKKIKIFSCFTEKQH